MAQYIETRPERPLLAFVASELKKWLASVVPEATDNHVILAAMNLVNCIPFTTISKETKRT